MEGRRNNRLLKIALVLFLNIPLAIAFYFLALLFFMGKDIHDGDTVSMVALIMVLGFSLQLLMVYRIMRHYSLVRSGAFLLCFAGGVIGWIVAMCGFWLLYFP